jgi:hypothetical protein
MSCNCQLGNASVLKVLEQQARTILGHFRGALQENLPTEDPPSMQWTKKGEASVIIQCPQCKPKLSWWLRVVTLNCD